MFRLETGRYVEICSDHAQSIEDFDSIPIIDFSELLSEDANARRKLAEKIYVACSTVGFFYAVNHGIPQDVTANAFEWSKKFFHGLTTAQKMKIDTALLPDSQYQGYFPFGSVNKSQKKLSDLMEAFNINYDYRYDPDKPSKPDAKQSNFINLWPDEDLPEFKLHIEAYHAECLKFSRRLVKLIAMALGLSPDYFDDAIRYPTAGLRIAHYPKQEASANDQNGLGAHTDFDFITLVNQGNVGGLQVLNKKGQWIKAQPLTGSLVVNVGDCLMRLSNNRLSSTVHRVVNESGQARYSMPFFFGLNQNYVMEGLPSCVSDDNKYMYPVTTVGEYLEWRSRSSKSGNIHEFDNKR
ncbi:hypothetical protein KL907_004555 [Ogataea polymorpha]|uniref:Fe2OG dioxygenase domain-containing protein n=2 Tax=Ogataea polymorpha TaxID=460523 RepID=A0A9P8PPS6_9ASCO|nr:hypothetical protein KL937_004301 [Ogataea polymorpha]KAG7901110.1 hypothetical protein KL907_004555 [Ogataea polymorpha]KAG7906478.1 hypothetical protein KL906_004570 [Ogataea polymorpha]KAG7932520.1 hypothetical protein KL904_004311 [Ogataea polymorpha]KAH3675402.1 hypothetical protein OGATHE_001742 [Ogataea polymorpha]